MNTWNLFIYIGNDDDNVIEFPSLGNDYCDSLMVMLQSIILLSFGYIFGGHTEKMCKQMEHKPLVGDSLIL